MEPGNKAIQMKVITNSKNVKCLSKVRNIVPKHISLHLKN